MYGVDQVEEFKRNGSRGVRQTAKRESSKNTAFSERNIKEKQ